jgi:hypothetical protein
MPDSDPSGPQLNEGGNWGLVVVAITVIGLIAAGMVYSAFFKAPTGH